MGLIEDYLRNGSNFIQDKNWDAAIDVYKKIIDLDPNISLVYQCLSTVYFDKGELDIAIININKAIEINSSDWKYHFQRGLIYKEKGIYNEAINDFEEALRLEPNETQVKQFLENTLERKNKIEQFDLENKKNIDLIFKYLNEVNIDYVTKGLIKIHYSHYVISWKLSDKQNIENNIVNCSGMIQIAGAIGYTQRAMLYIGKGDLNKAISDLTAVINEIPDVANTYRERGIVYGERGDFDKSITDLDKAIKLNSDFAESYYYRCLSYLGKRNFENAFSDCDKALKLKSLSSLTQFDAYLIRGYLHILNIEFDKAIIDFEEALKIKIENVNKTFEIESLLHENARKFLRFAQQEKGNTELIQLLQNEKIDKKYRELVSKMKTASTHEVFIFLSSEFQIMNGYKDTYILAEQCVRKAEEIKSKLYQELLCKKDKALSEYEYKNLYDSFIKFDNYENAKAIAAECFTKFNELKEKRKKRERIHAPIKYLIENIQNICKILAIISIIVYIIMFFIGSSVCPNVTGVSFDLILMTIIFLIPFIVIFFTQGIIKRILLLIVCISICVYFLFDLGLLTCHNNEIFYATTAIICNGVACVLAMIFPSWR